MLEFWLGIEDPLLKLVASYVAMLVTSSLTKTDEKYSANTLALDKGSV